MSPCRLVSSVILAASLCGFASQSDDTRHASPVKRPAIVGVAHIGLKTDNLSAARISDHIIHVGVTVQDRAAADQFYKETLGFREMWHGGRTDDRTDWVDMRVPDGADWLEYMLNARDPSPRTLGVLHHLALGV